MSSGSLTGTACPLTVYGIVRMQRALSILRLLATAAVVVLRMSAQDNAERSIKYRNAQYGFCFSLPPSWKGYSVVNDQWEGSAPGSQTSTHGPELRIRHPKWTKDNPYEDIPIMIFTHPQWRLVSKETIIVSAAPFGPSELGSNARYLFALPPRFDYDFATGWQEVEDLIRHKSLHAPCRTPASGQ